MDHTQNFEHDKNTLRLALKDAGLFADDRTVLLLMDAVEAICKRRVSQGDATWAHPAIKLVATLTGRRFSPIARAEIKQRLGKDFDRERLVACLVEWDRRGYNRDAWGWLDWYAQGSIPSRAVPGSGPQSTTLKDLGLA